MKEMLTNSIQHGGLTILPLLVCSVIALAVVVERLIWGPKRSAVIPKRLLSEIKNLIPSGKIESTLSACASYPSPLARVAATAIQNRDRGREKMFDAIEMVGKNEANSFQKNLNILGTIAAISPLLGLLGTVFGMITTFTTIQKDGVGNAPALAGGISQALITTAAGLSIAIPALIFHRYFHSKANKLSNELETSAHEISELLDMHSEK